MCVLAALAFDVFKCLLWQHFQPTSTSMLDPMRLNVQIGCSKCTRDRPETAKNVHTCMSFHSFLRNNVLRQDFWSGCAQGQAGRRLDAVNISSKRSCFQFDLGHASKVTKNAILSIFNEVGNYLSFPLL